MLLISTVLLGLGFAASSVFAALIYLKKRKLEKRLASFKHIEKTFEQLMEWAKLQDDLSRFGGGLLRVQRVDPADVFFKAP